MPEWLVENGIGEERALLLDGDDVIAARLNWPGSLAAGQIEDAVLTHFDPARRRGAALFASGEEALVDRLPAGTREGASIRLEVTRPAIAERGRLKRARARPSDAARRAAPALAESLGREAESVRTVHRFPAGAWEEVWSEAWSAEVSFPSGSLLLSITPAMTVIDVDGISSPPAIAQAAVAPLAAAVRRLDLGGSIGIDFPTLERKEDRKAVDEALAVAFAGWPHERTAMNGFGFVQLVARLERPSLLHRLALSRAAAAARMVLRRAEQVGEPGALLLTAQPAVVANISEEWLAELGRRTGRDVRLCADPALAFDGGFAQAVPQ